MEVEHEIARYREFQEYVGWSQEDAERVRKLGPLVESSLDEVLEDFYAEIDRHPNARKVITGGQEQIDRLKQSLRNWLKELFSGNYDEDYIARRWKVGWRHVEIGLDQAYPNVALARLRNGLIAAIELHWTGDPEALHETIASLQRLIDLDLALITDAYQTESEIRLHRSERLAAIGQVAGGIAHELRNPLNVVKTSVYYLLNAKAPTESRIKDHLVRIDRQVGLADGVISALSNFAKLPLPNAKPFSLGEVIDSVLENCTIPAQIEIDRQLPADLPMVLGDADQLAIVFSNLTRNACDAMAEGGRLTFAASATDQEVVLEVRDTGVGIPRDKLSSILEPLYSTKARGIGLGLAISKAILDKNGAIMSIASELGQGSTFSISLGRAPSE